MNFINLCLFDIELHVKILQAVRFLHDLGSIQHFQNEHLRNRVVINPQWIVDAMACIVSVHDNFIVVSIYLCSSNSTHFCSSRLGVNKMYNSHCVMHAGWLAVSSRRV